MNDDKGWLFENNHNISFWGIDNIKSTYAYFSDEDLAREGSSTIIYEINFIYFYGKKLLYKILYESSKCCCNCWKSIKSN